MNTPRPNSLLSTTGLARAARRTSALLLAGAALAIAPLDSRAASATPPDLMAYQGFLVDANANPLAPTNPLNYPAIFRIYTASTGGTLLWSEQQVVTVDKGHFSVLLGQGTQYASESRPALSSVMGGADASELYVGVTVTIDASSQEILPRLRLMTSPYAFLATRAANLVQPNGTPVISYTGGQIQLSGPVNVSGTVTGNGSGLTGLTAGQIPNLDASKINSGVFADVRIPNLDGSKITGNLDGSKITGTLSGNPGFNGMIQYSYGANDRFGLGFLPSLPGTVIYRSESNPGTSIQFGKMGASSFTADMTIAGSGNVGIGTTEPAAKLHVQGNVQIATGGLLFDNARVMYARNTAGNFEPFLYPRWADNMTYLNFGGAGFNIRNNGSAEVMFMTPGGNVGIGTSGPADRLHVVGALRLDNGGGRFIQLYRDTGGLIFYGNAMGNPNNAGGLGIVRWDGDGNLDGVSDRRLKQDITDAEPVLERVMQLPVRRYHWKNAKEDAPKKFGVIAQEVAPLFPDSVGSLTPPDGMFPPEQTVEMMTVKHGTFGLIAVKALQELKQEKDSERDALKAEISQLKEEVARLKSQATRSARVDAIQQELDDLKQVVQRLVTNRPQTQTAALKSDR